MNQFENMTDTQLIMIAMYRLLEHQMPEPGDAKYIKDELLDRAFLKREDWIDG